MDRSPKPLDYRGPASSSRPAKSSLMRALDIAQWTLALASLLAAGILAFIFVAHRMR